jgi:two-component system, NarL family, response regulator NreC
MSIKIFLTDDHTIVRQGLRALLEGEHDFVIIGEAIDGQEALNQVQALEPDVLVLDLSLPEISGLEVIRQLYHSNCHTRIVVLSMYAKGAYIQEALKFGAKGYVLKGSDAKELAQAIRLVMSGGTYLSPAVAELAKEAQIQLSHSHGLDPYKTLTNREREILPLTARGLSSSEIGKQLNISPRTVEVHRARILHKLGLQNQAELIRFALQRGILPIEDNI